MVVFPSDQNEKKRTIPNFRNHCLRNSPTANLTVDRKFTLEFNSCFRDHMLMSVLYTAREKSIKHKVLGN